MSLSKKFIVLVALLGSLSSCGGEDEPITSPLDASLDAPRGDADRPDGPDFGCVYDDLNAPTKLECAGLYSDWAKKTIAPGVREFAPSSALWSDGAEKRRWIYLPPGTTIDATSRTDWVFPVGTTFWKEFSVGGRRIETRIFKKVRSDRWVAETYKWSKDETSTQADPGGDQLDIDVGGAPYHIATQKECSDCHKGRRDRVLGFEEILLGGPNATGLTLAKLVAEKLLSPPPPSVNVTIPDDGTGFAPQALGWIHVNCGVTCHNRNSEASGNGTKMFLRLNPADLATKSPSEWDPLATTLRVSVNTPGWNGETRVVPGAPDRSLLVRLISSRGDQQMPPIGTNIIDQKNVESVKAWIAKMQGDPVDAGRADADAGAPDVVVPPDAPPDDASIDVHPDAGEPDVSEPPDAGTPDVSAPDAQPDNVAPDATPPDAGTPDAAPPDAVEPDVGQPDVTDPDVNDAGSTPDAPEDTNDDHSEGETPIDSGHDDGVSSDDGSNDAGAPDGGNE